MGAVETTALVRQDDANIAQFMPVMDISRAVERYNQVLEFTQKIMKEGKDYGKIPGSERDCLLKPGAEKLCSFFGLTPEFVLVEKVQEWTGAEPFFYYWFKCRLWRGTPNHPAALLIAEADGSCNSRETKYRYRWVAQHQLPAGSDPKMFESRGGRTAEPEFAIQKAETSGKYGKPAAYWQTFKDAIANGTATPVKKPKKDGGTMDAWEIDTTVYRVPNPDVCDSVNTIQKISQKRSLIATTLIACNASEYFTQDLDDMEVIDLVPGRHGHHAPGSPPSAVQPDEPAKVIVVLSDGSSREVPTQLLGIFERLGDKGGVQTGIDAVKKLMVENLGADFADATYQKLLKQWNVQPKSNPFNVIQGLLLDMFEAAGVDRKTNNIPVEDEPNA